jgi:hypothetical protein
MKTQREKSLYPVVEKWMKRHFLCFKTAMNKGLSYSRPDVIGIRDTGGNLSGEVQTIIIEVKKEREPFASTSGQTYGYTVYANRIYLAESRNDDFSVDEMDIASHLGIGLIQIRGSKCNEVLSSPSYTPIKRLNLRLLETLGLGRCQFCDSFFEMGDAKDPWSNVVGKEEAAYAISKAIKEGKGLMFWSWKVAERKRRIGLTTLPKGNTVERRFICPECVCGILAIDPDRLNGWISEHGRGG